MERTSLVKDIQVGRAADFAHLTLIGGLPDVTSLRRYFEPCPFIVEKAELSESNEDTDQGQLVRYSLQVNTHREETFFKSRVGRPLLVYIETVDGDRLLIGSEAVPVELGYGRRSGAALGDLNENSLTFTHTAALEG